MAITPQAKTHVFNVGSFVLGTVVAALIGVPTGLYVAKRGNTAMVVQQQTLTQVQTFETTGGTLDNAVMKVSDALVKDKPLEQPREALRDAVGAHSSATFALRDKLGASYGPYMAKMREMRSFADEAESPREGVAMWQSAADLIGMRKRAVDRLTENATK